MTNLNKLQKLGIYIAVPIIALSQMGVVSASESTDAEQTQTGSGQNTQQSGNTNGSDSQNGGNGSGTQTETNTETKTETNTETKTETNSGSNNGNTQSGSGSTNSQSSGTGSSNSGTGSAAAGTSSSNSSLGSDNSGTSSSSGKGSSSNEGSSSASNSASSGDSAGSASSAASDSASSASSDASTLGSSESDEGIATFSESNAYTGIDVEDNSFDDWDGVTKVDTSTSSNGLVNNTAMVFDGDYIYLYLNEKQPNSAAWSGPGSSGNFVITTDLGNSMVVHVLKDGSVEIYYNNQLVSDVISYANYSDSSSGWVWGDTCNREIRISKSALPYYSNTISFGYYLGDTFISDVSNFDGSGGNTGDSGDDSGGSSETTDATVDGDYSEWTNIKTEIIEYDTAGTQSGIVDAQGALYSDGDKAYGYVYTSNSDHLSENGYGFGEFNVMINNDSSKTQMVTAVLANADGTLDWNASKTTTLANGTYTFYLFKTNGWGNTTSLDNVSSGDTIYGKMVVTINGDKDQMEYSLDLATFAQQYNLSANDIGTCSVLYHRLGNKWLSCAGTSTDPLLGSMLCVIPTGLIFFWKKKKNPMEFVRKN